MPSTLSLLCATLLATTLATEFPPVNWDKYADGHNPAQHPDEPTTVDAAWEEAHGGAAPIYDAAFDLPGAQEQLASAATQLEARDAPPTIHNVAPEPIVWGQKPVPIHERDDSHIPTDPEQEEAWAIEHGYEPISKRSVADPSALPSATPDTLADTFPIFPPTINLSPEDDDPESDTWALSQGYRPLTTRSTPVDPSSDPDSERFAVENGYAPLPLEARANPAEILSEDWARENGYTPLKIKTRGFGARAMGTMNWVLALGRRPGSKVVNKRGEGDDVESQKWALEMGYEPLGKRGLEGEENPDVESEKWAVRMRYEPLESRRWQVEEEEE